MNNIETMYDYFNTRVKEIEVDLENTINATDEDISYMKGMMNGITLMLDYMQKNILN